MYTQRWALIQEHLTKRDFVLVDWGSDAGWFSVKIAHGFPSATVISVEAGIMSYEQGIRMHQAKLKEYAIQNSLLVNCIFGPDTFEALYTVPSDYQLVLSVFHHMGDGFGKHLKQVAEWDRSFCNLVRGSQVTFFEIPNEGHVDETPHRIRKWYDGREVEAVIRAALQRGGVAASVEVLGETRHGAKGMRKLFKISLDDMVKPTSARELAAYIDAAGRRIKIRLYRRFKMKLARLLRRFRSHGGEIVRENQAGRSS
jgi:hypothetical protein